MKTNRSIILAIAIAALLITSNLPCRAQEDENSIWHEEDPRGPRRGPRMGRRLERFKLTDEEVNRIISSLKESEPQKAKELAELSGTDPEKFQAELRRYGHEEFGKIMRERMEDWRNRRHAEFLEWFGKNYPRKAEELAKLKETEPDVYWNKFDIVREIYWRIFEEERRNPELAEVLKEDLELKEKREELCTSIKATKSKKEKEELVAQLEEVVSRRFDLIVKRKQILYELLLKKLEELRQQIKESKDEIVKWQDDKSRAENVKARVKYLTEESPIFRWD